MTRQDAVNAYIRGDLDRRGFIRRLTAVGVSAGAAMAYASALVPGVSAGSARNGAGFVTRFQDTIDDDYGAVPVIEDMAAALAVTATAVDAAGDQASSILDAFTAADFAAAGLDDDDYEVLGTVVDYLQQLSAAVRSILDSLGGAPAQGGAAPTGSAGGGDLTEQLAALADQLDDLAGFFVALVPSIEDPMDRMLLTQVATVTGRMAALVGHMVGRDPLPEPFETPIDPIDG